MIPPHRLTLTLRRNLVVVSLLAATLTLFPPHQTPDHALGQEPVRIVPTDGPDGMFELVPALQRTALDSTATVSLSNGGPPATFELTVVDVVVDSGVERIGGRRTDITPAADTVTLATDERAEIPLFVAPGAAPGVVSVQVRVRNASPPSTIGALLVVGPPGQLDIDVVSLTDRTATFDIVSSLPDVIDVTARVRAWPGLGTTTVTTRDVVVVDSRQVQVDLSGLTMGRLSVDVAAASYDHDTAEAVARATATAWRFPGWVVATCLLVVIALAAWGWRRRRQSASDV